MIVFHYAVLLMLNLAVALIDREIKRSLQQSVLPRLVDVKLVIESTCAWHKVYNNAYCRYENGAFIEQFS